MPFIRLSLEIALGTLEHQNLVATTKPASQALA